MIDVTRGLLSMYARLVDARTGPQVIISDFPVKWTVAALAPLYDTGVHAVFPSQRTIPAHLLEAKIKNRSRLHYLMANLDVALHKAIWKNERHDLRLRFEFFNLTNHPNFQVPSGLSLFNSQGNRLGTAGRITATSTTSRQIQVAAKWIF